MHPHVVMRPCKALGLLLFASLGVGSAACTNNAVGEGVADVSSGFAVDGEAPLFPGFSYDTGLMPSAGPAQASFKASIGGALRSTTRAQIADGKAVGVKGSGKLAIDLHAKLAGRLKVTSTLKSYDGEIPGLENIDIAAVAEASFDPFLVDGQSVEAIASVPETKLPDVPLGSVPGHLELTVKSGSTVTAKLAGSCLSGADSKVAFTGATAMSGKIVLEAKLVLDLPRPLDEAVTLPLITIDLPETKGALASTSAAVSAPTFSSGASCGSAPPTSEPGTTNPALPPGQCTALVNVGQMVPTYLDGRLEPTAAGGKIEDGTYVLTAVRKYVSQEEAESYTGALPSIARTLRVAKGKFEVVSTYDDGEKTAYSGVYIANGKLLSRSFECSAEGKFTDAPGFTANSTNITLFFASDHSVHKYAKQ